MRAVFAFHDDAAVVDMRSCAEDFLGEYTGIFQATRQG
jgi:hypothetical protein